MTQSSSDPDDRRKHLEFLQALVVRMSLSSSTAKSWLLPVVTATYGYSLIKKQALIAFLGVAAALLISFQDANYLRQEKAYRRLYDVVARQTKAVPPFCMDPSVVDDPVPPAADRFRRGLARWFPGRSVWLSWTVAPFYGSLVVIGCLIAALVA